MLLATGVDDTFDIIDILATPFWTSLKYIAYAADDVQNQLEPSWWPNYALESGVASQWAEKCSVATCWSL